MTIALLVCVNFHPYRIELEYHFDCMFLVTIDVVAGRQASVYLSTGEKKSKRDRYAVTVWLCRL